VVAGPGGDGTRRWPRPWPCRGGGCAPAPSCDAATERSATARKTRPWHSGRARRFTAPVNVALTSIEAHWLDEHDPYVNAMGSKGIGEIGITGTAAAVSNAVWHATGVRVRDLPVTLDKVLAALP
jgi:CO/xanthine dehydrogenase Mo-binding subunit